jgi:predicted dehydrogenase
MPIHRRRFLKTSTTGAAWALAGVSSPGHAQSANDAIQVGIIGPGSRGTQLMRECIELGSAHNARLIGVCDIWNRALERAARHVREVYGTEPKVYRRHEELLADKEIDAIIIATPDHQHARMLMQAVEAGKDVYCEKPMANILKDANDALAVVRSSGRVVQMGTQRRSLPRYQTARDLMREGRIGRLVKVDICGNQYSPYRWAFTPQDYASLRESDVDWKAFLMGKPDRPFDPKIYRSYRLFREFSGAIIDQWMSHSMDMVHFLTDEPYPLSSVALGGVYEYRDFRENPDTIQVAFEYGRKRPKFLVSYSACLSNGTGWGTDLLGTNGTLEVEDRFRLSGDGLGKRPEAIQEIRELPEKQGVQNHMANWLSAIRQRKPAAVYAPVEAGYGQSIACIMSIQSYWSGRRTIFDAEKQEIRAGA